MREQQLHVCERTRQQQRNQQCRQTLGLRLGARLHNLLFIQFYYILKWSCQSAWRFYSSGMGSIAGWWIWWMHFFLLGLPKFVYEGPIPVKWMREARASTVEHRQQCNTHSASTGVVWISLIYSSGTRPSWGSIGTHWRANRKDRILNFTQSEATARVSRTMRSRSFRFSDLLRISSACYVSSPIPSPWASSSTFLLTIFVFFCLFIVFLQKK